MSFLQLFNKFNQKHVINFMNMSHLICDTFSYFLYEGIIIFIFLLSSGENSMILYEESAVWPRFKAITDNFRLSKCKTTSLSSFDV
jgi:hypothetical protein